MDQPKTARMLQLMQLLSSNVDYSVDGYIGESTRSEIEYAKKNGKAIEYLEPVTDKP